MQSFKVCYIEELGRTVTLETPRKRIGFRDRYSYQSLKSRFEAKLKFGRLRHRKILGAS